MVANHPFRTISNHPNEEFCKVISPTSSVLYLYGQIVRILQNSCDQEKLTNSMRWPVFIYYVGTIRKSYAYMMQKRSYCIVLYYYGR